MWLLKKILPILFFGSLFFYVIYFTPYPENWAVASTIQILSFFIPLLFLLTSIINIMLNYLPKSFIIACGLILLLTLWSINLFNFLTATVIIVLTILSFRLFPKLRYPHFSLTRGSKITKIPNLGSKK